MAIRRNLAPTLKELARSYPVVTVTGPRQSGKTTLARMSFRHHAYVSLEPLDTRSYAREDPRGFLAEYKSGAVIDEVQNAPEILSYLQQVVDEDPTPGRWILTGSQHFGLLQSVTQSLAGRTGVLHLLPLSFDEVRRFDDPPTDLLTTLWIGGYPRIHDQRLNAARWLTDYVTTYVQRDVRQILNVGDLEAFTTFVRLSAGRTATELNLSALGSDAGVSHNTARAWLSALEASFIFFRVPPWRRSHRKQLIKAPKIHFFDSGLVCSLLGITQPEQLRHHPLRGQVFESWVASEVHKHRTHRGYPPALSHYRDSKGLEVDLVLEGAQGLSAIEAKSGSTLATDATTPLQRFASAASDPITGFVVHGGEERRRIHGVDALPWSQIQRQDWR
ncbi:MAG TPA: ATP-binding protein [Actinomycetota bacterium]